MGQIYRHNTHSVSLVNYHLWIREEGVKLLVGRIKNQLESLIKQKAMDLGIDVISLEIMPDHLHLFVNANPNIAANQIVAKIKGYSSRALRLEYPELMKMPSMWTRSYFVSRAGNVSSETIRKYIEAQTKK